MYSFLDQANTYIWNTNFKKAEEILKPLKSKIPSAGMLYSECTIMLNGINGDLKNQDEIIRRITDTELLVKSIQKSPQKISDLGKLILQQNMSEVQRRKSLPKTELKRVSVVDVPEKILKSVPNALEKLKDIPVKPPKEPLTDLKVIVDNLKYDLKADRAMCLLFKALNQIMSNSFIKGGLNLRSAWKTFQSMYNSIQKNKDKIKLQPVVADKINFGYGTFLFIVSVFPDLIQKVLRLVGFRSNRDLGIKLLHTLVDNQGFLIGFASFILAVNYLFLPRGISDPNASLITYKPILDLLMTMYPKSSMLRFISCQFVKKFDDTEAAITHLTVAIEQLKDCGFTEPTNFMFELGYSYYLMLDWKKAQFYFEKIMKDKAKAKGFMQSPYCGFLLAMVYSKLGMTKEAIKMLDEIRVLSKIKKMKKHRMNKSVIQRLNTIDKLCTKSIKKKVRVYDESKLLGLLNLLYFEALFLRRDLAHGTAKNAKKFLALLKEVTASAGGKEILKIQDIMALYCVVKAQLMKIIDDKEEAKKLFFHVIKNEKFIKKDKQWVAFAKYELGEVYYHEGKFEDAIKWMKLSRKVGGYPFENVLKARAAVAVKQITKEMKNPKKKNVVVEESKKKEEVVVVQEKEKVVEEDSKEVTEEEKKIIEEIEKREKEEVGEEEKKEEVKEEDVKVEEKKEEVKEEVKVEEKKEEVVEEKV